MSLAALQIWFYQYLPELVADFNPPATAAEITHAESILGFNLPPEFIALYQWHNGQKNKIQTGPFYGLIFLSLEQVIAERQIWIDLMEELGPEGLAEFNTDAKSAQPKTVKKHYTNARWVPFAADWCGNYLGIDLDPDTNGSMGQVINYGEDEDLKHALAKNLTLFIEWLLAQLQGGNFKIKLEADGGRSFNTLKPASEHFLDAIRDWFPVTVASKKSGR